MTLVFIICEENSASLCVPLCDRSLVSVMDKGVCKHISTIHSWDSCLLRGIIPTPPPHPPSSERVMPALQGFRCKCFHRTRGSPKGTVFLKLSCCHRNFAGTSFACRRTHLSASILTSWGGRCGRRRFSPIRGPGRGCIK